MKHIYSFKLADVTLHRIFALFTRTIMHEDSAKTTTDGIEADQELFKLRVGGWGGEENYKAKLTKILSGLFQVLKSLAF